MKKWSKKELLDVLGDDILDEVMTDLRVYDETFIYIENSKFYSNPHTVIRKEYATDYQCLGYAKREDFLTKEEIEEADEKLSRCQWF